jgi:hypothetical protein
LCLDPLHVSGVKRPSSGGTTLADFGVSYVHCSFGWLQVVGCVYEEETIRFFITVKTQLAVRCILNMK